MNHEDDFGLDVRIEESLYGALGTSDCHKVGIMGGCGLNCWVYQERRCPVPEEMSIHFECEEDKEYHEDLYGKTEELESE